MRDLISQPVAVWIALVAVLVGIVTLWHTLKKSRGERQLDSAARRTHLYSELNKADTSAHSTKMNLERTRYLIGRLNSHHVLQGNIAADILPRSRRFLRKLQSEQAGLETQFAEFEKILERLQQKTRALDDRADPKKIESLIPEAERVQVKLHKLSSRITSASTSLENTLRTLDALVKKGKKGRKGRS